MADSDAYDVPRRPNHAAVADYFASRAFARGRRDAFSPGGVRLRRFRALESLRETERALVRTKERREKERPRLDERWAELEGDQSRFRRDFLEFDKFVEENDHKRRRAAQKMLEKDNLSRIYDRTIGKLRQDCGDLEELITAMDSNIEKYHVYENFLLEVVRVYGREFSTVSDVVERFVTLTETRDELQRFQNESFGRLDELRKATASLIDRHRVELVGLDALIADLRSRRDRSTLESLKVESALDSVLVESCAMIREAAEARDACARIYREMCARRKVEPAHTDAVKQLEYIKKALGQYRKVNEAIAEAVVQEGKASRVAKASQSENN